MACSFWPLIKSVGGGEHLEIYPIVIIQPHGDLVIHPGGVFTPSAEWKNDPLCLHCRSAGRSLPCNGHMAHCSQQLISF